MDKAAANQQTTTKLQVQLADHYETSCHASCVSYMSDVPLGRAGLGNQRSQNLREFKCEGAPHGEPFFVSMLLILKILHELIIGKFLDS